MDSSCPSLHSTDGGRLSPPTFSPLTDGMQLAAATSLTGRFDAAGSGGGSGEEPAARAPLHPLVRHCSQYHDRARNCSVQRSCHKNSSSLCLFANILFSCTCYASSGLQYPADLSLTATSIVGTVSQADPALALCQENEELAERQTSDERAAELKQKRTLVVKLRKLWGKKPQEDVPGRPGSAPVRIPIGRA